MQANKYCEPLPGWAGLSDLPVHHKTMKAGSSLPPETPDPPQRGSLARPPAHPEGREGQRAAGRVCTSPAPGAAALSDSSRRKRAEAVL